MKGFLLAAAVAAAIVTGTAGGALAHCDTLDGPVVRDARLALEKGDVKAALPWVAPDGEAEVREAFALASAIRGKGPRERELADRFFFETLVRVHRAGEGAPYTGLKAAGLDQGPAIPAAEKALESGDPKPLAEMIGRKAEEGIRRYHAEAMERKAHAGESVEAGRAYVGAYVPFLHYVERLYNDAATRIAHGAGEAGAGGGEAERHGAEAHGH